MEVKNHEFPLVSLFRELRNETTMLIRQEVALAKAEISENFKKALRDVAMIAAGGLLAFTALIFLLIGVRNILLVALVKAGASPELALWISPIIVALLVGGTAWALIAKGKKALANQDVMPRKTAETLREDKIWVKRKLAHS